MRLRECNRDDETLTQELATAKLLLPLGWAERTGKAGLGDTRPWRELGTKEERWRSRKLKPFTYHHQNSQETGCWKAAFWSEAGAHPTLVAKPTGIQRAAGCGDAVPRVSLCRAEKVGKRFWENNLHIPPLRQSSRPKR